MLYKIITAKWYQIWSCPQKLKRLYKGTCVVNLWHQISKRMLVF